MVEERNLRNGREVKDNHCEGIVKRISLFVTIRKVEQHFPKFPTKEF